MKVGEWLAQHPHPVNSVLTRCSLLEMLDQLLEEHPFPTDIYVVDDDGYLQGRITAQAVFSHYLSEQQPVQSRRQLIHRVTSSCAAEMMEPHPIMVCLDDELDDILPNQLQQGIIELAVVDQQGKLCGVVDLYSVVRSLRVLDRINEMNLGNNPESK